MLRSDLGRPVGGIDVTRVLEGRSGVLGAGLLLVSAAALAGCGGSGGQDTSARQGADLGAQVVPNPAAPKPGAGGGKVSAREFCDALAKAQPAMREQEPDEAMATLNLELAGLYGGQDAMAEMVGVAMDDLGEAGCPDSTARALKAAGITSFRALRPR
jgi:hypothetical protein